jgi:hypothetical protein
MRTIQNQPSGSEGYYLSAEDMKAHFNRLFGSNPSIRFYPPVGKHGDMSSLLDPDIDGYFDSLTGERVPSFPEILKNPVVKTIIIPIHHSSDRSVNNTDPIGRVPYGKDHWDGYVLVRAENGTFKAFRLETPPDGYCGQHFIDKASEIASGGLPAFINSENSSYLSSLQAKGLSENTQMDATKLVSLGVELFSPQELQKPKKSVRFSEQLDHVKKFYKTEPVSALMPVEAEPVSETEPALMQVETEPVNETKPALMPVEAEPVSEPISKIVLSQINHDLENMNKVKVFVETYLKKHFSNDHTDNGNLSKMWEQARALEPDYQQFLKRQDFSQASFERRVKCLALSASINPDFEKWIKKYSAAGHETRTSHANTARLKAKEFDDSPQALLPSPFLAA